MAYYHQPCDSYFVESHDDCRKRRREELREHERLVSRQRQLDIGNELSRLASEEYREDILQQMEAMESRTLPDVSAIEIQTEIQWFMRPYLLDFLIEAHNAFGLLEETLFSAVNILDRYCSKRIVYKKHYQLVGCSALLIASKYGDRKDRVPTIKELKTMCCSLYDDQMFIQMEWHVLQTLDWAIGHPTVDGFLQLALEGASHDPEVEHMAWYISEIAMFHKEFVSKRPSDIARSSLALARCILGRPQALRAEWASKYEHQTLSDLSQLLLHQPSTILSRKYSIPHLSRVSRTLGEFMARQASINRFYGAPPTPPAETYGDAFGKQAPQNFPVTPTKPAHFLPSMNNGCPTPPETPTYKVSPIEPNVGMATLHRPPTPGSLYSQPSNQPLEGRFSLPPISQMAPIF